MATVVVPSVVRLSFQGRWTNGRQVVNVLDVSCDEDEPGEGRQLAIDTVLGAAKNAWQAAMLTSFLNNYTFEGIQWVDLATAAGNSGFEPPAGGLFTVGQITAAGPSPNVASLVHKVAPGSRAQRNGRWYLPPPAENDIDEDGTVSSGYRSVLQSDLNDLMDALTIGNVAPLVQAHPVVVSYDRSASGIVQGEHRAIDSMVVDLRVATLRRRLRP